MPARSKKHTRGKNEYFLMGSNNVECDRTGFKMKADQCRFEWNGYYVRDKSWEERQPQDFLRGLPDRQQPAVSRPGTGDVFLEPGDVTENDL